MASSLASPSSSASPSNPLVTALLTDLYQLTMTYAHWKNGKHNDPSVFELFFRKNPFSGHFTIFCGLDECLKHIRSFAFSPQDIDYLKSTPALAHAEEAFFEYLAGLKTTTLADDAGSAVFRVRALPEGTVVFPRVPMLILEAPLGLGQLLETTLLNLVNYPSLICTNAARMVLRANGVPCIEFGLRRAQGPDGACSASKYSYLGGFVATSNVQAGKMFGIPISGTHAHSFVQSFTSLREVESCRLSPNPSAATAMEVAPQPFLPQVLKHRAALESSSPSSKTNDGELAAFCAYACAFPKACLCLIDTYDTLQSGLWNFIYVALALHDFGYVAKGIRLDSGDLGALSLACQDTFQRFAEETEQDFWNHLTVVASNDINEDTLYDLQKQSNDANRAETDNTRAHGITAFGIGTNLVTCQKQPALGCVYKLVEWKGQPRIKLSQDFGKMTIPGQKRIYRLIGSGNGQERILVDYMTLANNDSKPEPGQRVICRHPFRPDKRYAVTPTRVVCLHSLVFSNHKHDKGGERSAGDCADDSSPAAPPNLSITRDYVQDQLALLPPELKGYQNKTTGVRSCDVMVSQNLFRFIQKVWEDEAPIEERY